MMAQAPAATAGETASAGTTAIAPVTPRHRHAKGDPLEGFNRDMFSVHQALDKVLIRPVAMASKAVLPKPVRSGVHNALVNLTEPIVFLNDLLQLRPGRALRTLARFALNSSVGVGGLIDVAKHEKLPHRENGFGDTLGYYGVGPGPYLFLPLIGPSNFRDIVGSQGDQAVLPVAVGKPFDRTEYQVPTLVLGGLDQRVAADADLKALFDGAVDPYATLRSVYLQDRTAEIAGLKAKGNGAAATLPDIPFDDPLEDPAAAAEPVPNQPATGPGIPEQPAPDQSASPPIGSAP